jgi:hypothetical protein
MDPATGWTCSGADDGTRTRNRRFTKPLLYQLSYVGAHGKPKPAGAPVDDRSAWENRSSALGAREAPSRYLLWGALGVVLGFGPLVVGYLSAPA